MVREYSNPQGFDVEKTLTTAGVRDRGGCLRRPYTGEGAILTQEARIVGLGLLANHWPMIVGVYWLGVAIDLGSVRARRCRWLCRHTHKISNDEKGGMIPTPAGRGQETSWWAGHGSWLVDHTPAMGEGTETRYINPFTG